MLNELIIAIGLENALRIYGLSIQPLYCTIKND
jgi:hypothetical protein